MSWRSVEAEGDLSRVVKDEDFLEMSRHEGVSCDGCLKSNFMGRRYKCLRCFDYDLCATCFERGSSTARHEPDHPLQCILSRTDYELYYGGESSTELNYALTCPICGRLGFTESELQSHVSLEHQSSNTEVVCPICATSQGGEPNLITEDLASHLTLEHRQQARGEDAPSTSGRQNLRRAQQGGSRTLGVGRGRRPNMHFSSGGLSPSGSGTGGREPVDPIAELLSQLSGVRRAAVPYDRLLHPRHGGSLQPSSGNSSGPAASSSSSAGGLSSASSRRTLFPPPPQAAQSLAPYPDPSSLLPSEGQGKGGTDKNQFLLDKCLDSTRKKVVREEPSLFLQDLLLATMSLSLSPEKDEDDNESSSSTVSSLLARAPAIIGGESRDNNKSSSPTRKKREEDSSS